MAESTKSAESITLVVLHMSPQHSNPDSTNLTAYPERLPLRSEIFVLTLPFDQDLIPRYITEGILHRTRRRWSWFAEAQRLNPSLGTLQYLPAEVRREIWKWVFHCRGTMSADGLWEYDRKLGSMWNTSACKYPFLIVVGTSRQMQYGTLRSSFDKIIILTGRTDYFGFGRIGLPGQNDSHNLRQVSSLVKAEVDDVFLSQRSFRFNDTSNLDAFLRQLTSDSASLIASMEIGICPMCE